MEMVPLDLITGPILCRHCGGNLRWYRGGEAERGRRNNGEAKKIKEVRNYVACLFQNLDLLRFSGDSCMNVSGVASWCNFSSFESEVDFWVSALHLFWVKCCEMDMSANKIGIWTVLATKSVRTISCSPLMTNLQHRFRWDLLQAIETECGEFGYTTCHPMLICSNDPPF